MLEKTANWAGAIILINMIEKALFISRYEDIKYWKSDYTRIYYGIEFCERLIPDKKEIMQVLRFVRDNRLDFTFVTPFVTNKGISKLKELFGILESQTIYNKKIEVVINDFGVLRLIKNCKFKRIYGRLLTKHKRDPRIFDLIQKEKDLAIGFNDMYFEYDLFKRFLDKNKIKRIEMDNLIEGINFQLPRGIPGSLYYPYIYLSTTRMCLFNDKNMKNIEQAMPLIVGDCKKRCKECAIEQSTKKFDKKIVLAGNTQFIFNNDLPKYLEEFNINRIVFQPDMPM